MEKLRKSLVFLLFAVAIGCFLSVAVYSAEIRKQAPPAKSAPPKIAPQPKHVEPPHVGASRQSGNRPEHRSEHRDVHHGERHNFRGHDSRHFSAREREIWHGGSWRHEWYRGRLGWWWVVGGMWYFYPVPVYPYPMVAPEIVFDVPAVVVEPPPVVVERPVAPPMRVQPQTQQFWYRCDDPPGYSPYITSCPSGWRKVPAQAMSTPPQANSDSERAVLPPSSPQQ